MNQCLKEINTDTAYKAPQPIPIPPGTRIPVIEVHTVSLSREEAHNLWSWWAFLLDVHRFLPAPHSGDQEAAQSFIAATFLSMKLANVTPIQKESPLTNFNYLRSLSLTKIITRLFQTLVLKFELSEVLKSRSRSWDLINSPTKKNVKPQGRLWSPSITGWNGWIGKRTLYGYCHATSSAKHSTLFLMTFTHS